MSNVESGTAAGKRDNSAASQQGLHSRGFLLAIKILMNQPIKNHS
ncbi:MAG: hypothetical protein JWQ90_3346 [Hydrocarboniphaga sp.]|nr:hypothetical protein [Hydrocarboniphaga sp.]